uniref:Uncharacterized protein n=1 Tax=Setaria italica TaxID=4555 RepID=K3YJX2_SETIT
MGTWAAHLPSPYLFAMLCSAQSLKLRQAQDVERLDQSPAATEMACPPPARRSGDGEVCRAAGSAQRRRRGLPRRRLAEAGGRPHLQQLEPEEELPGRLVLLLDPPHLAVDRRRLRLILLRLQNAPFTFLRHPPLPLKHLALKNFWLCCFQGLGEGQLMVGIAYGLGLDRS